ncbi:MAG: ImcF-related family protein, partial [Candidatus Methylumidiphilus sp.]
ATSYSLNKAAIAQTEAQIARYRAIPPAAGDSLSQFKMLGAKLDVLLGVRDLWANTGLLAHFGLWQGGKLQAGAEDAYGQLAQDYFQPALVNRLRERMQGPEGGKPEVLYQLLRVYLMFGQPDKLEPKVAMAVIRTDWERGFAIEPETLTGLTVHLQNLLAAAPLRPTQLDEAFITSMRARLTQVRQDQQCYERFKAEAVLDHSHDFNVGEALKPNGAKAFAFADGREISTVVVPGLFTAWGYGEFFLKKSLASAKDCLQQNWVLGNPASSADPREIERLHDGLKALYLGEYQQQWSALLAGLKLRPAQNMKQTVDMLDMLSRPDSPVRLLLLALEKNTALSKVSAAVADLATQAATAANLAPDEQTKKLMGSGAAVAGFGGGGAGDSLRRLESYFEGFNTLVRGEPPPLDATLAKAKELRDYFMQTGGNPAQAAASQIGGGMDVAGAAKMEFARLPEPVKSWLLSLTGAGVSQTLSGAKGALNSKLAAAGIGGGGGGGGGGGAGGGDSGAAKGAVDAAGGGSQCKRAFAGRYPFAKGSGQDAPLLDFAKFFAPNGVFDQFFQANLKEFVETGASQWRPKSADGQSMGLSQAAISEFQRAAKIRDAFFIGGGQSPQVQFDIKPVDLDARVDSFKLIVEGQEIAYRRGAEQASRLQWPGPAPGSGARIVFETADKRQAARGKDGPWALFRLLDESGLRRAGAAEQYTATFQAEGFTARYEIRPLSVSNPLSLADLQNFHCPESL